MTKAKRLIMIVLLVCGICLIGSFTACNDNSVKLTLDNYTEYLNITYNDAKYLRSDGDWKIYSVTLKVSSKSDNYKFKNCKITFDGVGGGKCKIDELGNGTLYGARAHTYLSSRITLTTQVEKISGRVIIN